MTKRKIISIVLCFILIFCVASCGDAENRKKQGTYPDFLTKQEWEYNTISCAEILHFHEDGRFSYYEACGNPVEDSDCLETYSYDDETGVVTAYACDESIEDLEIVVLRYTEDSLLLSIEGLIKEFNANNKVPSPVGDMYEKLEGYSAYVSIGDIGKGKIEVAPYNTGVTGEKDDFVREEKISEEASFYCMREEITHIKGEEPDKITTDFVSLKQEDVVSSDDSSFDFGYIWYNENLEITKVVYYSLLENWK